MALPCRVAVALLLALTACGSEAAVAPAAPEDSTDAEASDAEVAGSEDAGQASDASLPSADDAGSADAEAPDAGPPPPTTVFTIVLENHDYKEVVGNTTDAPYINKLIARGALATNYLDSGTHPSLPNYLYMVSGDTQYPGKIDLLPTTFPFPVSGPNLGSQLTAAKIPWRSYQEDMVTPCKLSNSGTYAPRHDPFLYFKAIQGDKTLCASTQVDLSKFDADLAAGTYRYMWITPNLLNDGHDPDTDPPKGLRQSDAWLKLWIPKLEASAVYKAGGAIFITWDEAEGRNGDSKDQVPMIILSPRLKAVPMTSGTRFTHASYLAFMEDRFDLPRLGAAAKAASLAEFFK